MSIQLGPEAKRLKDRLEDRRSRELQKLTSLLQVSQALSGTLDLRPALQEVFDTLARHHEALGSVVALQNRDSRELQVEAVEGLGKSGHHASLTAPTGVIAKVVDSGKSVVVPRLTMEPTLAQQLGLRPGAAADERSFLCVPVSIDRQP